MKCAAPLPAWRIIAYAGCVIMVALGIRLTVGLFVHPLMHGTGMQIAEISTALAIGQLSWGLVQPVFGAWADKGHGFPVLATGALCIVAGQLLTIVSDNFWLLVLAQGILAPAGIGAASLAILMSIVGRQLPSDRLSVASGIINAGGSAGQFVFAPIVQFFIHTRGYVSSLLALSCFALASLLPAWRLCRNSPAGAPAAPPRAGSATDRTTLRAQLRTALRDPSYLLLNAGFFTCGFHVAFLVTHLPSEVVACGHSAAVSATSLSLIGLCNIAGSIGAGYLGRYCRMKLLLSATYAARAVMIAAFMLSSKSEMAFYIFSIATGFTWLATVPPTAGIVAKLFGQRYVGTLFGMTFLTHQVGGFLGAWMGGVAIASLGSLDSIWLIDITLAGIAALVNLPIREEKPVRRAAAGGAAS